MCKVLWEGLVGQACRMHPAVHSYHTPLSRIQSPYHLAREQAKTEMDIGDHRSNTLSRLSSQEIHGIRSSMWKWPDKSARGLGAGQVVCLL